MADLRTKAGVIRVVGMHLDLSGLWRRRQAAAILAHLSSCVHRHPTVMMGDLNEWTRAAGCLKDFTRDFAVAETGPSFHARRPIGRLDRIMVSPELKIGECGVHATPTSRRASDHLPIWAMIGPADAREGASAGAGLLWRDQSGRLHARHHQGNLARRARQPCLA